MPMYEVIYSAEALSNLDRLLMYIAQDSGDVDLALQYLDRIEAAVEKLGDFPYLGVEPESRVLWMSGHRVLIIDRYLAYYRVQDDEKVVVVSTIRDSRMDVKTFL